MNAATTRWMVLAAVAAASVPVSAQSVSSLFSMSFGTFIAGSGGTITVNASGGRSQTGGVILVGQGTTYSTATFRVSGTNNASYTITLPPNGVVTLVDGALHTMALNGFASSPPTGTLGGGGSQLVQVGATLTVAGGQPPGSYTGNFNVTVNY